MLTTSQTLSQSFSDCIITSNRTTRNVSVEMKLLVLLFGFPLAFCYVEEYKGFENCGFAGWTCGKDGKKSEITYSCDATADPNARLWVWTARLPSESKVFTIRNCQHLEIHMDCTAGYRSYILRRLNIINVTNLEFLPPLKPHIFLHDNDQVPQAPSFLHLSDIGSIKLYSGMFDKPQGKCTFKNVALVSLSLNNVHIEKLEAGLLDNLDLMQFALKQVKFDLIEENAINLSAQTIIRDTIFPVLNSRAIMLWGQNISLINNTFSRIQSQGLSIQSKHLTFSENAVEEISSRGLNILGTHINISNNLFNHLETGAFENITAAHSSASFEVGTKFTYTFTNNIIKNINPGSLHVNWEVYKNVCSDITFHNNTFECSCTNLGWTIMSSGLGPKLSKVKEFYDNYFIKEGSSCLGYENCPLKAIVNYIQDVCNNVTSVPSICVMYDESQDNGVTNNVKHSSITLNGSTSAAHVTEENILTNPLIVTSKETPISSFKENQTSLVESNPFSPWAIVVPTIVFIAAALGIFMCWHKKKKQRQVVRTLYKNERGVDADSLIVINEHHNELYDKQ